jgi:hypothetical protein
MPPSSDLGCSIPLANYQHVTARQGVDCFVQLRSLNALPAGPFLLENLLASGTVEQRDLTIEVLMVGRNTSVSDVHMIDLSR